MLTCPMCKKRLPGVEKQCANCKTDVSLLVDYVENLTASSGPNNSPAKAN